MAMRYFALCWSSFLLFVIFFFYVCLFTWFVRVEKEGNVCRREKRCLQK
uniref:Uncharacterized protein n=1 Tax=Picea sitchensis TaxID=3332 RepID=D5AB64_PICSI|nr:unknown [Picea sitchensis]